MTPEASDFTISHDAKVIDALRQLNELSGHGNTVFALDEAGRVVGSISDGDLRRSLISGHTLDTRLTEVMHRDFRSIHIGDTLTDVKELLARRITLLPELNADGTLARVLDLNNYRAILPVDAVLMAGGRGERLRPLTLTTPKPLLAVGDRAIIDYNIALMARYGIRNISVTTNYLASQIERHFSEPVCGIDVKCVREPRRLGTAGSLTLVKEWANDVVLLMNSDLLTTIDLGEMYRCHISSKADMTMATIPYVVSVPYAIIRSRHNRVTGLEEKPTYNYLANAGIYMLNRRMIELIPEGEFFDAPDLMLKAIAQGLKVSHYAINGLWLDIGSPHDFAQAQELMKQHSLMKF